MLFKACRFSSTYLVYYAQVIQAKSENDCCPLVHLQFESVSLQNRATYMKMTTSYIKLVSSHPKFPE